MKTTKPLSTISYNTAAFLLGVLDDLITERVIQFYALIHHEPEEDENKPHWHVYMEPCESVDMVALRDRFKELDLKNPKQALGCMIFKKSNFYDWYWYGLHNPAYLASKGQTRKYHYDPSRVLSSDPDQLLAYVVDNPLKQSKIEMAQAMLYAGADVLDIAKTIGVAPHQLAYFMQSIKLLGQLTTSRGDRSNHEPNNGGDDDGF